MSRGERGSPATCGELYYLSHTVLIKDERNAPKSDDLLEGRFEDLVGRL